MFTEEYIKSKIESSDIWVVKSLKALLAEGDLSDHPHDQLIFAAMLDYHDRWNSLADKHMIILRKMLVMDFLPQLVKIANSKT